MPLPVIAITNQSTVLTDDEVRAALPAFQKQVSCDFKAYWDIDCSLTFLSKDDRLTAGWWQIVILDDPDVADALGYHEMTVHGTPLGKVFAKLDKESGSSWTVTLSHELLEMLADPWIDYCVQGEDERVYALEVCDAVEADELGYDIDGVRLSDFVTPSWFESTEAQRHDFLQHLTRPLELAKGGYISILEKTGWTQITASLGVIPNDPEGNTRRMLAAGEAAAAPDGSRRHRRTLRQWRKSTR